MQRLRLSVIIVPFAVLLGGCNHFPTPLSGAPGLDVEAVVTPASAKLLVPSPPLPAFPDDCQRAIDWENSFSAAGNGKLMGLMTIGAGPASLQPEDVFERYRNNCISIYMAAIDASYEQYKRDSIGLVGNLTAGADFTQTALSAASTAVGGVGAKTLLSGIATAVGTAKTQISADVLYNTSIQAAFAQMDADRNSQHAVIIQRMQNSNTANSSNTGDPASGGKAPVAKITKGTITKKLTIDVPPTAHAPESTVQVTSTRTIPAPPKPKAPTTSNNALPAYTMYEAANDLVVYYNDGTFAHGVVSLQEQAGAQATNCKATVKNLKTTGTKSGGAADTDVTGNTPTTPTSSSTPNAQPSAC